MQVNQFGWQPLTHTILYESHVPLGKRDELRHQVQDAAPSRILDQSSECWTTEGPRRKNWSRALLSAVQRVGLWCARGERVSSFYQCITCCVFGWVWMRHIITEFKQVRFWFHLSEPLSERCLLLTLVWITMRDTLSNNTNHTHRQHTNVVRKLLRLIWCNIVIF